MAYLTMSGGCWRLVFACCKSINFEVSYYLNFVCVCRLCWTSACWRLSRCEDWPDFVKPGFDENGFACIGYVCRFTPHYLRCGFAYDFIVVFCFLKEPNVHSLDHSSKRKIDHKPPVLQWRAFYCTENAEFAVDLAEKCENKLDDWRAWTTCHGYRLLTVEPS